MSDRRLYMGDRSDAAIMREKREHIGNGCDDRKCVVWGCKNYDPDYVGKMKGAKLYKRHVARHGCEGYCAEWEWEEWLMGEPILTRAQKRRREEDERAYQVAYGLPSTAPCKCGHVKRSHSDHMGNDDGWSLRCRYCACARFTPTSTT